MAYAFENVGCGIDRAVCVVFCVCTSRMSRDADAVGVPGRMKGVLGCRMHWRKASTEGVDEGLESDVDEGPAGWVFG